MGLFEKIFGRRPRDVGSGYWKTLTAYSPVFRSFGGELYESELVRAAIDARARHASKLEVTVQGSAKPKLQTKLKAAPNSFQTWGQFLYRTSTILDMQNTAFIVPVLDEFGQPSGIWPVLPSACELVNVNGDPWLRYSFASGDKAAITLAECGVLTKFQYHDDIFGESNGALNNTLELIGVQAQGISEAVKNSNSFRFMARVNNFVAPEDLAKERERFTDKNMRADGGGLLLFPNTYNDIRQIESKPYTVDAEQVKLIQTNVFNYYGVNEKVLQNSATGDELGAFFDGAVEPFAIQLSDVLTRMLFSERERSNGAKVLATANRLQYMKTTEKIDLIQQLGDRGMLMIDEARALLNYPPLPDGAGQRVPIRGEYYFNGEENPKDAKQSDE